MWEFVWKEASPYPRDTFSGCFLGAGFAQFQFFNNLSQFLR